jgi:hypothetical protein
VGALGAGAGAGPLGVGVSDDGSGVESANEGTGISGVVAEALGVVCSSGLESVFRESRPASKLASYWSRGERCTGIWTAVCGPVGSGSCLDAALVMLSPSEGPSPGFSVSGVS